MRKFVPPASTIAQMIYKKDYFYIVVEKYGASLKIKPK